MMADIGDKLLERVKKAFKEAYHGDMAIGALLHVLESDKANYDYAGLYAQRVGELLAAVYGDVIKEDDLPNQRMYWNIAQKVIQEPLVNNYNLVADACEKAQKAKNEKLGIGLNPIRPKCNHDRIKGIMNKVSDAEHYSDAAYMLDRPVANAARAVVDDSVHANADFMNQSGFKVTIVRTPVGNKTCDWCKAVSGTYDYDDVKQTGHDVWRRHLDCNCRIEYISAKGRETVNNYKKRKGQKQAVDERKAVEGLPNDRTKAKKEARKQVKGVVVSKYKNLKGFNKLSLNDKIESRLAIETGYFKTSDKEIDDICDNDLSGVSFAGKPKYNGRIKSQGKTTATLYPWGEVKTVRIEIGKQSKDSRECLIDTILHEELEARIMIKSDKSLKYNKLNKATDIERHAYIDRVIKRYFKLKGWDYDLV